MERFLYFEELNLICLKKLIDVSERMPRKENRTPRYVFSNSILEFKNVYSTKSLDVYEMTQDLLHFIFVV